MRATWRRFFRTRRRRTSGWFERRVKRNLTRFPEDFLFQLTPREFSDLRSRSVISDTGRGGRRYLPQVFTEHACHDKAIAEILDAIRKLMTRPEPAKRPIGFVTVTEKESRS